MTDYREWTPYPQEGYEYKYWGKYGPKTPTRDLVSGAITVFVVLPLLFIGLVALVVLVLLAIAVPPVGIALLTRGDA